jgi:hypothetical protein
VPQKSKREKVSFQGWTTMGVEGRELLWRLSHETSCKSLEYKTWEKEKKAREVSVSFWEKRAVILIADKKQRKVFLCLSFFSHEEDSKSSEKDVFDSLNTLRKKSVKKTTVMMNLEW